MSTDSDDSTYSASSSLEESLRDEEPYQETAYLTKYQLDEMWEYLQQLQDKYKRRDDYFQRPQQDTAQYPAVLDKITPELFNPACSRANLSKMGGKQVIEYAQQLQKYAPKIITIHETRRFWQMYRNQLDAGQLETLNQYVKGYYGFLSRQRFLSDVKKRYK